MDMIHATKKDMIHEEKGTVFASEDAHTGICFK
jgi:hypothetical protein